MSKPEGRLSPAQYEILETIWDIGAPGASGIQVWERISEKRTVVRTTVINLMTRLEARGWLKRTVTDKAILFWPTMPREQVEADVAEDFVECFFGGSASQLILSLLGRERINPKDIEHLKEVYEKQSVKKRTKRRRKKGK